MQTRRIPKVTRRLVTGDFREGGEVRFSMSNDILQRKDHVLCWL